MDAFLIRLANWVCGNDNKLMVILFIINLVAFVVLVLLKMIVYKLIHPTGDMRFNVPADMHLTKKRLQILSISKGGLIFGYTLYANLTAIFPLLGILGTVAALVTYESSEDMMKNLTIALATTLAGVFFAIIFKFLDSFIAGGIDILVGQIDYMSENSDTNEEIRNEI